MAFLCELVTAALVLCLGIKFEQIDAFTEESQLKYQSNNDKDCTKRTFQMDSFIFSSRFPKFRFSILDDHAT